MAIGPVECRGYWSRIRGIYGRVPLNFDLSADNKTHILALLCFALICIGDFEFSQLSCLSSLVGRASHLGVGSSPT